MEEERNPGGVQQLRAFNDPVSPIPLGFIRAGFPCPPRLSPSPVFLSFSNGPWRAVQITNAERGRIILSPKSDIYLFAIARAKNFERYLSIA